MTDEIVRVKGTARVYCCGGAGMNIGAMMEFIRGKEETGMATFDVCYIDTSSANYHESIPTDSIYFFTNLDGSGGIRNEHNVKIAECVRPILQKFPPMDINIVISSGSGGSGSVVAPSIVSELLVQDKQVVAIMIGDTQSRISIKNTLKTLMSYSGVSKTRSKSLALYYAENSKETPQKEVDSGIMRFIVGLAVAYSRENKGLDSKDLYNMLNFDRVTTYETQLAGIAMHSKSFASNALVEGEQVISMATVAVDTQDYDALELDFVPDYRKVGQAPKDLSEKITTTLPMNIVVTAGMTGAIATRLNTKLDEVNKAAATRAKVTTVNVNLDDATDNGLVL